MSKPKQAQGMSISLCEEDHVHIDLVDESGEVFATAAANIEDMGEQLLALADHYLKMLDEEDDDDEIGPVEGSC